MIPPNSFKRFALTERESLTLKEADFRLIAPQYTVQLANLSAYIANPAPQMHAPVSFSSQLRLKTDSKDLLLENESSFTLDVDMASGSIAFEQLHLHASGTYNGAATQLGLDSPLLQLRSDSLYSKTALLSLSHAEQSQQLTLSTAELKITPDQIEAPDLRVVYQRGLGKNHFELDLRSPIIFKQLEGLWEAGHLQGRVLLPQATAPSPISGQAHGSLENKLVNLTLFSRLNDSPVNFQGEIVGYQHPSIKGELVIGRSRIKDLELLSSVSNSSQPLENTVGDRPSTDDDQSTRLSDKETAISNFRVKYNIKVYTEGIMYYIYYIKDQNYKQGEDGEEEPYYSVMRNTIYGLTVEALGRIGTDIPGGWNPESDPEDPIDQTNVYMIVQVKVNPWVLSNENITLE